MNAPHGWQMPTPPRDLNGWGHYITRSMEHVLTRLHYVEQSHNELKEEVRSKAQESAKPADHESMSAHIGTAAKEVGTAAKELGLACRWIFLIVVVVLLATKKLDLELLSKLPGGNLLGGSS